MLRDRIVVAAATLLALAGCESQARQDPLLVRGQSDATVFGAAPIYVDRPLAENIEQSLIFADYRALAHDSGWLDAMRGPGPFTVFVPIDPAIDDIPAIYRERMTDPANRDGLRRLIGYTIVRGAYRLPDLQALLMRGGGRAGLPTVGGAVLGLSYDPTRTRILLTDPEGRTSDLVLAGVKQSNGVLYAANRVLAPDR